MADDFAQLGHLNLIEFCRESSRWGSSGAVHEEDGVLLYATGSWVPSNCNGAFRLDAGVDADTVVRRADEFFGQRRRGWSIVVRVTGPDDDLIDACMRAGMQHFGGDEPQMVCAAPPAEDDPPQGIELRMVTTDAGVEDFVTVNADAYSFGMPPGEVAAIFDRPGRLLASPQVASIVAYRGADPVAAAQVLLSHGVGGVYWVGTVTAERRRGLGGAVTRAMTGHAFDREAAACVLQASAEGESVYRRLGYEETYRYRRYVRLHPPARSRRWRRR